MINLTILLAKHIMDDRSYVSCSCGWRESEGNYDTAGWVQHMVEVVKPLLAMAWAAGFAAAPGWEADGSLGWPRDNPYEETA